MTKEKGKDWLVVGVAFTIAVSIAGGLIFKHPPILVWGLISVGLLIMFIGSLMIVFGPQATPENGNE